MKRWIAMMMALAIILSLAACGGGESSATALAGLPEHAFGQWLSPEENQVILEINPDGSGMVWGERCTWTADGTDPEGSFVLFAVINGDRRFNAMVSPDRPEMILNQRIEDVDSESYTTVANLVNEGYMGSSQGGNQDDLSSLLPEYAFGQWSENGEAALELYPDGSGTIWGESCTWEFDGTDPEGCFMLFAIINGEPRFHAMIYPDHPVMTLNQRIEGSDSYSTVADLTNLEYADAPQEPGQDTAEAVEDTGPQTLKDGYLVPEFTETDWLFAFNLEATSDTGDVITQMNIRYLKNGNTCKDVELSPEEVQDKYGLSTLEFGKIYTLQDSHPITAAYDEIIYSISVTVAGGAMNSGHEFKYQVGLEPPVRGVQTLKEGYMSPRYNNGNWTFECVFYNTSNTVWTLDSLEVSHMRDGKVLVGFNMETREEIPEVFTTDGDAIAAVFGTNVIQPGQHFFYVDNHPIVETFNEASYTFHITESNGTKRTETFLFQLGTQPPLADYTGNTSKDVEQMRHDASFEIEVADGVYWVPVNALGQSRYTNGEIFAMLSDTPEEKQAAVSTLYEAMQLYRIGGFYSSDDNVRIFENNLNWEHHKPGYDAVRTNNGCCATDSNWLRYILDGDYEEVGYIATSQRDGSGHVYNYIYQDGWYYTIDLTYQHAGTNASTPETGNITDYTNPFCVFAAVHKCRSLEDYAQYCQDTQLDPPGLMFRYVYDNVPAIDSIRDGDRVVIIDPIMPGLDIQVIFDDPNDNLTREYHTAPQELPNWSGYSSYIFPG